MQGTPTLARTGGMEFDSRDDMLTVQSFDYSSDGTFSLSMWITEHACSRNNYEIMYEHTKDPSTTANFMSPSNAHAMMYLVCDNRRALHETWTVIRFHLRDDGGTMGQFDYALHETSAYNQVEELWKDVTLVVTSLRAIVYINGQEVLDGEFSFDTKAQVVANAAFRHPGSFRTPMTTFTMLSPIYIGGFPHRRKDRHFRGKLAGVYISENPFSVGQVRCMFNDLEQYLPTALNACEDLPVVELSVSFLQDSEGIDDISGWGQTVALHGDAHTSPGGLVFDGSGDFATVANWEYADADFAVSLWMTKADCSGGIYEYIYSHAQSEEADIFDPTNSNINMYFGCEEAGGGWSSLMGGSIIRYNLVDGARNWVSFDYPVHDAGDFDAITQNWMHIVMLVSPTSVSTYVDASPIPDATYGSYTSAAVDANSAWGGASCVISASDSCLNPSRLNTLGGLAPFNLVSDLFLGGRADQNEDRHFVGRIALVDIFTDSSLTAPQIQCLFEDGDVQLPEATSTLCAQVELDTSLVATQGGLLDVSGNDRHLVAHGNAHIEVDGAHFDGEGDFLSVPNFSYADGASRKCPLLLARHLCFRLPCCRLTRCTLVPVVVRSFGALCAESLAMHRVLQPVTRPLCHHRDRPIAKS